MEAGRDVLIVYDDLTHHARACRELSLLLSAPGRRLFRGMFSTFTRACWARHPLNERGGGSLTALPIIETRGAEHLHPTNLISITDGQIVLYALAV
jgi:F-type H+-transporting ATPase subunit alpha